MPKDIAPFVEKHCVLCHGPQKKKGDLELHVYKDEMSILKARRTWMSVLDQLHAGEMPPKERPRPAFDEAERFAKAVRGVFERFDRTAARDPGVVTMRRLNRAEYVNTIRDLVGVTIPLGDDFPADLAGYGFDNIGDILTLSPLQLERYLASAEAIVKAAIVLGDVPDMPKQSAGGFPRFEGTNYGQKYDDRGRIARDAKGAMIPEKERLPAVPGDSWRLFFDKGPLHKRFTDLLIAGDYKIIAKLQGHFVGNDAPKFALVVNGKEFQQGVCTEKAEEYSATVRLKPGVIDLGVSLLNEFTDPADPAKRRGIFLHSLTIVGPLVRESHEMLFAGSEKLEGDAKTRFVLERFATRAYRRPVTKGEVERLMRLVQQAEKISHYKLSEESFKKLQAARLLGDVVGRLKAMEKVPFTDEDRFVKSLQQRLKGEEFKTHFTTILDAAEKSPQPWEARIGLAVRAVLCSPNFLFRVELDSRPTETDSHPIDDYQLASRLSYFLWSSMPDQELFDLAAKKQLHQHLPAQVKRMVADPRSKALFDGFATQWLGLRRLQEFTPAPQMMPNFGGRGNWANLRSDMLTETGLFFSEIVREDRNVFDLIDARFTYVNQRLAQLYDIGDTNGNSANPKAKPINPPGKRIPYIRVDRGHDDGFGLQTDNPFVRVTLEKTRRGGILTHASVLTVTSHPTRTSLVKRGHWILEQILGTPPPPAPPNVPSLEDTKSEKPLTVRQQVEQHRKNPNTAVALPFLEAMWPAVSLASPGQKPPVRMAFIYVPNGIITRRLQDGNVLTASPTPEGRLLWQAGRGDLMLPAWTPEDVGALPRQLPPLLEPLANFRDDFSVITGLANAPGRAGVGHAPAQGAYLTCARPHPTRGSDFRAGISVDQVAANHLGDRARLPSLEIGCSGMGSGGECDMHACAYMTSLAWKDATTPLQQITNPRNVFDRLFATDSGRASAQREAERRSVLDFIREEAGSLESNLGASDRRKLDEYFTAIRDIEQRIERSATMPAAQPPEGFNVPDHRTPLNWADHARLLGDLMTLAFQTDTTRVCTFIFANELSHASYPYAGINDAHHFVSHHGNNVDYMAAVTRINLHMLEQFAHILRKLKETREGEGTLLDSCMIAYGGGNSDGHVHSKSNLPILLAGRAGGALRPGRHVRCERETPLANLWLSMLDRFGARVDRFGDSTGRLRGL